jgi:hypothetical protein
VHRFAHAASFAYRPNQVQAYDIGEVRCWALLPAAPDLCHRRHQGAVRLGTRQQRRARVVILTNARIEDIEDLLAGVRQLQCRHRVCVASVREGILDTLMDSAPEGVDTALATSAAARYLEQRQPAHHALRTQGTRLLEVSAVQLPGAGGSLLGGAGLDGFDLQPRTQVAEPPLKADQPMPNRGPKPPTLDPPHTERRLKHHNGGVGTTQRTRG